MEVDIPNLLETIAVCDPGDRIADEAKTVLRMSRLKCPSLGKEESLRSFIAVDLALGKLGVACSQDKLVNAAHAKDQVWTESLKPTQGGHSRGAQGPEQWKSQS
ncbi:unnamed protein product [Choristocarpus tenellus]